jgi:hypothetical protein
MINLRMRIPLKKFSEIIPAKSETSVSLKPHEILNEISKNNLGMTSEEFNITKKTGTDLYLNPDRLKAITSTGFFFEDINETKDLNSVSSKGWKLQYLKNMLLLQDYNNIFRDFLQSCALNNSDGLGLTCEPRLKKIVQQNIKSINSTGLNLELESLRIIQDYKILRTEIYKNIHVNREENKTYNKYNFIKVPTPLGSLVIAHEKGNDHSIAKDPRPFILATTMLVRSPMKLAVFNQNLSRKLHGKETEQSTEYVVRFESQFSYTDFAWILPTQNKPKRMRSTKITDFNNILRGNPYFENKFDLVNDIDRYNYMARNEEADNKVRNFIYSSKI